jgi:RNA polymerase sigma factor (TIGR02999 family)
MAPNPEQPVANDLTRMLRRWNAGDREALPSVASLAYSDLRVMAARFLCREDSRHTMQAAELVNEIYLRLAQIRRADFRDHSHFYAFAGHLMRMVLIDQARQTHRLKRPSSGLCVPLREEIAWIDASNDRMLAVESALDQLETLDCRKVRVIELRYFLGYTSDEAASLLGVSRATIDRDLAFGKAWLIHRLLGQTCV